MGKIDFKELRRVDKVMISLSFFLRVILLVEVGRATYAHQWQIVFLSSFIFILTFVPAKLAKNIKVKLPTEFEFIAILFIYLSLFLGELREYYSQYLWWDIMLHAMAGLVIGFIGFLIIFILYDRNKITTSPILIVLFSFCFAMALGAVWEISEFAIDTLLKTNMQKSGLIDTMWDLIIDAAGALIISVTGYFYLKGKPSHVIRPIVKRFINYNPQLYKK